MTLFCDEIKFYEIKFFFFIFRFFFITIESKNSQFINLEKLKTYLIIILNHYRRQKIKLLIISPITPLKIIFKCLQKD